jgi:hypothetical protein
MNKLFLMHTRMFLYSLPRHLLGIKGCEHAIQTNAKPGLFQLRRTERNIEQALLSI